MDWAMILGQSETNICDTWRIQAWMIHNWAQDYLLYTHHRAVKSKFVCV